MRKDVVYLGMIRWNDSISLNKSDEEYNNGKKYGQKGYNRWDLTGVFSNTMKVPSWILPSP
jgi:hypothetical protein